MGNLLHLFQILNSSLRSGTVWNYSSFIYFNTVEEERKSSGKIEQEFRREEDYVD